MNRYHIIRINRIGNAALTVVLPPSPTTLHKQSVEVILKRLFGLSVGLGNEGKTVKAPPILTTEKTTDGNPTSAPPPNTQTASSASTSSSASSVKPLQPESLSISNNAKISPSASLNQESVSSAGSSDAPREKVHIPSLRTNLSFSSINPQDDNALLASRRVDPTTVRQVFYFDTLAFSKRLESKGFTREQAEGCAEALIEIINTTLDHQGRHMVTKPQQEIAVQQLLSEIVSVKKDMTLLQKSEFSSLKTETEKMSIELSQIQSHMHDEILKLKGQFSLDINLERGRAIEAHAENEKKVQQLHNKIETEIANLKTIYEVYRNDVFKYAGGTVIAVGGLILGVLRLWQ